jgi:LPXTG-site transpeptidase (sortase) family protein
MFARTLVLGLCLLAVTFPDGTPVVKAPVAEAAPTAAAPSPSAVPAATAPSEAAVVPDPSPTRLLIPRIGVNATIEARGLDPNRNMSTASDFHDVAWYDLGPKPGEPGNALINGHVNWWTGTAVFTRLSELRAGDRVTVVRKDGTQVTFKVTARRVVAANARIASLFASSRVATLTLITCTGTWDPRTFSDTNRLLVSAVRV